LAAINPDDTDKPFVARWNALVSALLIEPSIKLVARTACDYGIMTGENVFPGNQRLARQTGYDERTVREAWHFLRAAGLAERLERSAWTGDRRNADRYELVIPSGWRGMPMFGPHFGRFACQHCGSLFNPQPCNTYRKRQGTQTPVTDAHGVRTVTWFLWKAAFCPAPQRGKERGKGCFSAWERFGGKWGDGAWEIYRKARNDDWPPVSQLAAA
jgi:hypothetical protein